MSGPGAGESYSTSRLSCVSGYSGQQIRDLERVGVILPARRQPNGYRQFARPHLIALRAYRNLAVAVGPVAARATMREIRGLPRDEAVARIVGLHVRLARSREDTLAALRALDAIVDESAQDAPALPADSMTITELSLALGVRSSTLRFWEQEGLVTPVREGAARVRSYPPDAVRDARIVAALRSGGYRIPAVRAVMTSLLAAHGSAEARDALQGRLQTIAAQSAALLRAGTDLADLLTPSPLDVVGNG